MTNKDFTADELHQIVKKLIGRIRPQGEANYDAIALNNLKVFTELTDLLLEDILAISSDFNNDHQASVKKIVKEANKFLIELDHYRIY